MRWLWLVVGGAAAQHTSHSRFRAAMPACSERGRVLVAFGAHTDDEAVQRELRRITYSAKSFDCPPHDVALFLDASRQYATLRHPLGDDGLTVRVPFTKLLKNGTAAFRAFVSHQLLMASLPAFLHHDKKYESVWVIEEDSRFAGGEWAQLFSSFNGSYADLIAYSRRTSRGTASLMAVARVSTRLFRAVRAELANLDARDRHSPDARPSAARKTIHGAFIYSLCQRAKWCRFERIDKDWLAVFRAKCPWSTKMFSDLAPDWPLAAAGHGRIFHPVKVHARFSHRDFKRFKCSTQFQKENVPNLYFASSSSERTSGHVEDKNKTQIQRTRYVQRDPGGARSAASRILAAGARRIRGGRSRVEESHRQPMMTLF